MVPLQHVPNLRAISRLPAQQPYLAAGRLDQAHQQREHRRFAAAGRAHDGDELSLIYGKREIGNREGFRKLFLI